MSINQENLLKNSTSQERQSVYGLKKEKLKSQKQMVDIEDTSMKKMKKNVTDKKSSMPEYLLRNKKETLNDKLNSYKKNIQDIKLSPTLALVSITPEKALQDFWKESSQEQLKKSWLPIKTDCVDLGLKSLNNFVNISPQLSQSSTIQIQNLKKQNLQKTSFLSLQFSQQDFMEDENMEMEKYVTRKFRIYPNQQQQKLFNKCINTSRFFYNKANEYVIKNLETKKETKKEYYLPSVIDIRNSILVNDSKLTKENEWQKEVPYDTRELAIRRLHKSYKTSFALFKKGKVKYFKVSFIKKKENRNSFEVNKKAITITKNGNLKIFPSRLNDVIRLRKRDRQKIIKLKIKKPYTNTVIKKEYKKWYICFNIPDDKIEEKNKPQFNSVFLDPGTRKFQTFYSPDGLCGYLGNRYVSSHITPLKTRYEKLQKIIGDKKLCINKEHVKERCNVLITKIQNIVSDLHNQTANFLTTTFKSIFIPIFETKKMVNKKNRKINKTTSNELLTLSHYKFREKLNNMCRLRKNNYKVVTEEYTSKLCSNCGHLHNNLGSSEVYSCKKCKLEIDRDINAARNIFLKNIRIKTK